MNPETPGPQDPVEALIRPAPEAVQNIKRVCWGLGTIGGICWAWMIPGGAAAYRTDFQEPLYWTSLIAAVVIAISRKRILQRFEKQVFGSPEYSDLVRRAEEILGKPMLNFGPVVNLDSFLSWTGMLCLVSSALQGTVGFTAGLHGIAICLIIASTAAAAVLLSARAVYLNVFRR